MAKNNHVKDLRRRLDDALGVVATLVTEDTSYLPLYERLEADLAELSDRERALGRAKALAARQRAMR